MIDNTQSISDKMPACITAASRSRRSRPGRLLEGRLNRRAGYHVCDRASGRIISSPTSLGNYI
jgi:hypothetical protein